MQTHEIINRFTEHFVAAGHTHVPSASLILDDPTLLFVNAGMVQFKPYFLGDAPAPYPRATSIQKCVRTGDIEEVGKTTRHNTFFQMAGNFSFGDYFKEGAIDLAWSLVTGPGAGGYGFDPDRLWATVYRDDDEASALWRQARCPSARIQRRGGKDNYWDMGIPGPGGPCSEIYFDRGPEHGRDGGPEADEDRYLEIWNLVFMQDVRGERSPKDDFPPIGALPKKNIDTGMGVERVATLLQGVESVYDTDLVRPVIARAEEFSGRRYGVDHDRRRPLPGDRRPRPVRRHDHRRRRDPVQRGPRLRAAPPAAPDRALGPAARRARAGAAGVRRGRARRDGPVLPGARHRLRAHRRRRAGRGGGVPPDADHRLEDLRHARPPRPRQAGSTPAARRPGVQAARHLRLPDRPHAGDGRRGRADRRRAGLPHAHGRAAQPGQGRRRGPQARLRRRHGLPRRARRRGRHHVPRLHRPGRPRRGSSGWSSTGSGCPRRARARPSRWCWTAPRSTPRAAASRPTPAGSAATGTSSTSPTCSRRSPGWSCTAAPCAEGEITRGRGASRRGRHRPAGGDLALALGHPPRARGHAQGPRRRRRAGGLAQRARAAAVRLHLARRGGARHACSPTSRTRSTTCC